MKYILVETCSGDCPRDCGAYIHGSYYSKLEAQSALKSECERWLEDGLILCDKDKWKPGYHSGESVKWSDLFWSENNTTAWRNMDDPEQWIKLEVFKINDYGGWERVY